MKTATTATKGLFAKLADKASTNQPATQTTTTTKETTMSNAKTTTQSLFAKLSAAQGVKTKEETAKEVISKMKTVKKEATTIFNTDKTYANKGGLKRAITNKGLEVDSYELNQNQDGRWFATLITATPVVDESVVPITKEMDVSAKASILREVLYKKGLSPIVSTAAACAVVNNEELMNLGKPAELRDQIIDDMWSCQLKVTQNTMDSDKEDSVHTEVDGMDLWDILITVDAVTSEGDMGKMLTRLNEPKPKAYPRPCFDSMGKRMKKVITKTNRRKPMVKGNIATPSKLLSKAINIMQDQVHTICEPMVILAVEVFSDEMICDTQWVIDGAVHQIKLGNVPSVHEWFACARARIYQGDSHGSNVQAGDMDRSFSSPHGVSTDYDIKGATLILENEAQDMVKCTVKEGLKLIEKYGEVKFIRESLEGDLKDKIKKPWSFVKVSWLLKELYKGNKPYLDVTVGLDAKCSGPQLGSLIVGCETMMAACGFSKHKIADAYEKAVKLLEKRGFVGFDRALVKGPFMGVFYGQGWRAFANEYTYVEEPNKKQLDKRMLDILLNFSEDLEESAKAFRNTIEASFGKKIRELRTAMKSAHVFYDDENQPVYKTHSATKYKLMDGMEVACQYFERIDIDGDIINLFDPADVVVEMGLNTYKFNKLSFNTGNVDLGRHERTGFVNWIQANDGLLARLIITKLASLDCEVIESVHDCFRVSVPDMLNKKLDQAIKYAYKRMFGSKEDYVCQELPEGQDAMQLYFKGLNDSLQDEFKISDQDLEKKFSQFQFRRTKNAKVRNIKTVDVCEMMDNLKDENNVDGVTGYSYPFAK